MCVKIAMLAELGWRLLGEGWYLVDTQRTEAVGPIGNMYVCISKVKE